MTKGKFILLLFATGMALLTGCSKQSKAEATSDADNKEEFAVTEFILDHIADSHEWHLFTTSGGQHVSVYLPVLVYSRHSGVHLFSSRRLAHGHTYMNFAIPEEGLQKGRIIETVFSEGEDSYYQPLDFSVTKNVAAMIVAAILILVLFLSLAHSYRRAGISEPKGLQGFLEPLILFVKEDIAIPNVGEEHHEKYLPYLLTVFFFILANNILGLVPFFPFGANVTGNIAVTLVLACFTFLITQFSGSKTYWKHIFATPGVPFWLLPIMALVELLGLFTKPFALMIRLFANITSGHIIVLSFVCIIFIFRTLWIVPGTVVFVLFMDFLELLVAFLQAYVFTLLSALFIGLAVEEHH